MTTDTPATDDPEIEQLARRLADPAAAQRRRLATIGVAGLIDPSSRVEALQERRDRDRARWLGIPTFDRPPTPAEKALISPVTGETDARHLQTRVDLRGGLYRRCWPALLPRGGTS
ncbi:hypothetical protein ABQF26_03720 [Mycolicibacterium elephantis]